MKLRKFGAACLASAVMMTSAAVLAYADDAAAADSAAATDAAVAALTASGLTQEQVVDLIKTATTLKSREEIAAFIGTLESAKPLLEGVVLDTIGDEDLGTIIASISPEDLGALAAWLAAGSADSASEDDAEAADSDDEAVEDVEDEDIDEDELDDEEAANKASQIMGDMIGMEINSYADFISSGAAVKLLEMDTEEIKTFCKAFLASMSNEDVAQFFLTIGVADENAIAMFAALTDEDIEALIETLTDDDIATIKAMIAESFGSLVPATGDVDAAKDSSKGSPDTGIEDVAVVAGLAVLALGGVMVAKKRK